MKEMEANEAQLEQIKAALAERSDRFEIDEITENWITVAYRFRDKVMRVSLPFVANLGPPINETVLEGIVWRVCWVVEERVWEHYLDLFEGSPVANRSTFGKMLWKVKVK